MTDQEKQTALAKNRILVLAILDYHLEHYTGSMVFDDWDPAAASYLQEKKQTERDYEEAKLDLLQQRLDKFVKRLANRNDLNFERYLRERTGYEIDIFENFKQVVAAIIAKGKIEDQEELSVVASMIDVNRAEPTGKGDLEVLEKLVDEFNSREDPDKEGFKARGSANQVTIAIQASPPVNESLVAAHTESTSTSLSDEETAQFHPDNGRLTEAASPDGQRKILTQTNGVEKDAVTEVSIMLKGGAGCVYCVKGAGLPLNASWKDNATVVIKTKPEYEVLTKHRSVSSFKDVVKIEYIER